MDQLERLQNLFAQVFDRIREDLRAELSPDEYEGQKHDFVFHLTDWAEDHAWFQAITEHPDRRDVEETAERLIGFLYHVIPHLSAAGRLLLDQIPDPFRADARPATTTAAG